MRKVIPEIWHKALHLLALREHSRQELQRKLLQRGYALPDVVQALDELAEKVLQSDARFAETYVHSRRAKGYGPERIRMELQQRGIAEALMRANINSEEACWGETAVYVYQKKFNKDGSKPFSQLTIQEKIKRQQFMRYRGFDSQHLQFLRDQS